ncbi:MAG: hypothetical protein KC501_37655 [Myxococcales bacterium]|nr:hypothetical protein [Myxococcales bacterium]
MSQTELQLRTHGPRVSITPTSSSSTRRVVGTVAGLDVVGHVLEPIVFEVDLDDRMLFYVSGAEPTAEDFKEAAAKWTASRDRVPRAVYHRKSWELYEQLRAHEADLAKGFDWRPDEPVPEDHYAGGSV